VKVDESGYHHYMGVSPWVTLSMRHAWNASRVNLRHYGRARSEPMPNLVLERQAIPLLEYDPSPGVIVPHIGGQETPLPERWVLCFFAEQIRALVDRGAGAAGGGNGLGGGPQPDLSVKVP
jgi:hypothetical protein